ncbi:hypothetical protein [Emticicia sp. 17c]|uniref:hypothetical protein n=1 Tax=Emticicia sp. 17c TaxID=3127704 RepID=UPI00301B907E
MQILILKTNIRSLEMKESIASVLNQIPQLKRWSVDYQDCDGVLRAETETMFQENLIELIKKQGFECEELND